jgi:Glycosyl transferases group 1
MRILIVGSGGNHRSEASIARAARALGHTTRVLDAFGWRRRLGRLAGPVLRWMADRFGADYVLCTRLAIAAGADTLRAIIGRRDSAFWYFDAAAPPAESAVTLARLTARTFATYGYQVDALRAAGAPVACFLPQGVDPFLDYPARHCPAGYRCEVSFVGSGQYPRRYGILQAVATSCRLQIRGPGWNNAPPILPIAGGRLKGHAFAQAVLGAAISLGVDALPFQREETRGGTSNRLWKVLGAGGLFLGEHVTGVEAFAGDGQHAVWYRSPEEAVEHIRRLLADPPLASRIARAGHAHALAHHTYRHRVDLLLAGQGYTST